MNNQFFKFSPSDFGFLWMECPRCFYLKYVHKFPRPWGVIANIFKVIDQQMKAHFQGIRTETLGLDVSGGVIECCEQWVESKPFKVSGRSSTCVISGKIDAFIRFDDGSFGVVDFKTSQVHPKHVHRYQQQLLAYSYALQHAAPGKLSLNPISKLGLLVFEPAEFSNGNQRQVSLSGPLSWVEIPLDNGALHTFLSEVLALLEQPTPPPASLECQWCQYRIRSRQTTL